MHQCNSNNNFNVILSILFFYNLNDYVNYPCYDKKKGSLYLSKLNLKSIGNITESAIHLCLF